MSGYTYKRKLNIDCLWSIVLTLYFRRWNQRSMRVASLYPYMRLRKHWISIALTMNYEGINNYLSNGCNMYIYWLYLRRIGLLEILYILIHATQEGFESSCFHDTPNDRISIIIWKSFLCLVTCCAIFEATRAPQVQRGQ
jgi:hypothetical protein